MCCIDKTSSAEVSEAIASMFHWYRCADVCYAYLRDVPSSTEPSLSPALRLMSSKWFKRGWTLQELIAPRSLVFLSSGWDAFGTKTTLANYIMSITHIPASVLIHEQSVHEISVAQRMSWAAARQTTRPEDRAYCLMGLFGVRIPVMYGEGNYAFIRLQEEILRHIPDPTLLTWGLQPPCHYAQLRLTMLGHSPSTMEPPSEVYVHPPQFPVQAECYMLATSPDQFSIAGRASGGLSIRCSERPSPISSLFPFRAVPCHMLHMRVPLIPLYTGNQPKPPVGDESPAAYLALLGCETHTGKALALLLTLQWSSGRTSWRIGSQPLTLSDLYETTVVRLVALDPDSVEYAALAAAAKTDVYAPVSAPRSADDPLRLSELHRTLSENRGEFNITLAKWCKITLAASQCFLVETPRPHVYQLSLPDGYETCPHAAVEGSHKCPYASQGQQCPEAVARLEIMFANCDSDSCRKPGRSSPQNCCLWGDVHLETLSLHRNGDAPPQLSPRLASCRGVQHHVASWTLRDGIALKTFNFQVRPMDSERGHGTHVLGSTRDKSILVSLALKRWLSESREDYQFLLEIDVCKQARFTTAPPSPVQAPDIDSNFLSPMRTSPTSDRISQAMRSIGRPRSNSGATISIASVHANQCETDNVPPVQQRTRSVSFSGDPSPPKTSPAIPILITPGPVASRLAPAAPTSRVPSPAPPSLVHPPPVAPIPVAQSATAPPRAPASTTLHAQPSHREIPGVGGVEEVVVRPGDGGAVKQPPPGGDGAETSTPKVPRLRDRLVGAAFGRLRRVMSRWGRSRGRSE
ncbi:hypothetical protein C8Q77DRAFT_237969 [Trametes polyzona]|nr:hypothetical protein C8Q77DRAFT_237969 [Trametes polyzona]